MSPLLLKQSIVPMMILSDGMKRTPNSISFLDGSFALTTHFCLSCWILMWKEVLASEEQRASESDKRELFSEAHHLWTGSSGWRSASLLVKSTIRSMDSTHKWRPCADELSYKATRDCATSRTSTQPRKYSSMSNLWPGAAWSLREKDYYSSQ